MYVCSSDGALRIPLSAVEQGVDEPESEVAWWRFPQDALEALTRRGLLVPTDRPFRRHPSYRSAPDVLGPVRVVGDDELSAAIA